VRRERDEEGEDGVARAGKVGAAPRSDDLAEEGGEGDEDAGPSRELVVVAVAELFLLVRVCSAKRRTSAAG